MADTKLRKAGNKAKEVNANPKKEEEMENNQIINDVTPETREELNEAKVKDEKVTKKPKAKSTTKGGDMMQRTDIEKIVKDKAKKAGMYVNQSNAKSTSSKPGPVQVRNQKGEVIIAVRAGELLFHLPHEEVIKEGKPHGGRWPHCTVVKYGALPKTRVENAVARALKEKKTVAEWKEQYGSEGRKQAKKDPAQRLKELQAKEAALKKEMTVLKKAQTKANKKKGTTKKSTSKAVNKVAEATA